MKKPEIYHYGIVKKGKAIYYNPDLYLMQLQDLEDKEFILSIKEKKKDVSVSAHGYYWGGVIGSALTSEDFGGWTKEEVHAYYTKKFLTIIVEKVFPTGEVIEVPVIRGTSDLSQIERSEYIDKVKADLYSEHGVEVLNPEQYNLSKYRRIVK